MPKEQLLQKVIEKPDEAPEVESSKALRDKDVEGPRRGARNRSLTSDPLTPDLDAEREHYRRVRARPSAQLDLYEGLSPVADGRPRHMRPSRQKGTVRFRCPACGAEIRVVEIALTLECPGCHAVVDALEVKRINRIDMVSPPAGPPSSGPTEIEPRWQAAEPSLPEALPSFFVRRDLTAAKSTAQISARRGRIAPIMWIAFGASVLLGAVAGTEYWRATPRQGHVAPEVVMAIEASSSSALPDPALVQPPPQLAVGLAQLGNKLPPDEPATVPVALPPAIAAAAEAVTPAAPIAVLQDAAAAPPSDDVFVVRFDNKLPGLTPSGLRALDAALRAADKGRKVRIRIYGCEDQNSVPAATNCAALAVRLKWILAHRGVNHPGDLVASLLSAANQRFH